MLTITKLETFCEQPGKLTKGVLFHQDNAPAHKSVVAMAAGHDCGFELIEHPPYSPDLAPSDCFLFPNMKKTLGWEPGKQYRTDDEVVLRTFSRIKMRAPTVLHHGNPRATTQCVDRRAGRGDYAEK